MPPSPLLVDPETGRIDRYRILAEAIPIAELVALVAATALVPFAFVLVLGPSGLGALFVVVTQFVLAVGAGLVLLYVITRAIQLTSE